MDRNIAVVTHEITPNGLRYVERGLKEYQQHLAHSGLDVGFEFVGGLSELVQQTDIHPNFFPKPARDGSFSYQDLDRCIASLKLDAEPVLPDFSDVILVVDRKVVDDKPKQWHTNGRNGEAYGGGCNLVSAQNPNGSYCFITLYPLEKLRAQKNRFVQYVLRHELGHNFGGFGDLSADAEDNAMRPVERATRHYLGKKDIEYTAEQMKTIGDNLAVENMETIKAFRARRNKGPRRTITIR